MTLNGVMAVLLHYSAEFGSFGAIYVKVNSICQLLAMCV